MTALAVGDRGIDYSYARPSLATGRSSGATFAIRYSAGAASASSHQSYKLNAGKLITPAEFKAILAAGYDPIANSEWYPTRIEEGATAGAVDGLADTALWRSCGLAKGASVYISWDTNPNPAKFAAVAAYLTAWQKASNYYAADLYAGTPALKAMLARGVIKYGWRTNASSWSNDGIPDAPDTSTAAKRAALVSVALAHTPAHIWQTHNYWFGTSADENLLLRTPCGSHLQALHPPVVIKPPTKPPAAAAKPWYGPKQNSIVSADGAWATFMGNDGSVELRHNGMHIAWLRAADSVVVPPVKPPAKPTKPWYGPKANCIVSADGAWAAFMGDDGGVELRHNGMHIAWLHAVGA